MPTTLPTAQGAETQGAYREIYNAIRLDVTFTIDELEVTSDQTALRSRAATAPKPCSPPATKPA